MPKKAKAKVMKVVEEVTEEPDEVKVDEIESPVVEPPMKTIKKKAARKPNNWVLHCKKVQSENPGISYREVLKLAKTTYKKDTPKE